MTKRYSEMNQHDALYRVARAYPGGVESLAGRMGKSPNVLYNKLRPGILTHHVSFEELSEIIEHAQSAGVPDALQPLQALNLRHGLVAFALPALGEVSDETLASNVCRLMREVGELSTNVATATQDDRITAGELDSIERDFQTLLAHLGEWRTRLRERAAHDAARRPA